MRDYLRYKVSLLLCAIFITIPGIIKAQKSEVKGVVHNEGGATIFGAHITVLNSNSLITTDRNGKFNFIRPSTGAYKLEISALGFATVIKVIEENVYSIDVTLIAANRQLDEVIVTAGKRDDPSQKLPLSLTYFSSEQVQEAGLLNIKDITAIVPNLYASNPGDNRNVVSVRGLTATSYDPTVATYIDGVNQFSLDTYIAQLTDVERIEVLRGPQGTLYGRNAMGGVVNIITKAPGDKASGFAEIRLGNYQQQQYSIGLRIPVIKNKLFFGIAGLFTTQEGFYTNRFNESKFDDQHSFMGNYHLKFIPNQKLAIQLNVKHVDNHNKGAFPLASDPVTALADPFTVNQNNTTTMRDDILNTSLSFNYNGAHFNLNSQSSYQSNHRYYTQPIDGDFSPIDGISIINNYGDGYNRVKVATQEFRLNSPAGEANLNWVGGVYGFYQKNPVKQAVHFGEDGKLVGAPFPNFSSISTNRQNVYGVAVYGQGDYKLSSHVSVLLGARYDYEHHKLNILGEFQLDGEPATVSQADTSSSASFKALSPKASITYHITTDINFYVGYNRGYRTGGISQLGADPTSQPPLYAYRPEKSNNFEFGMKSTFFEKRLRINTTLFYTKLNDVQVPTLILPDAITIVRNAGKLNSKGAEVEITMKPLKRLEAAYSFGSTHARFKSLYLAANGEMLDLSGNHQIFTPDVTSMFSLQYNSNDITSHRWGGMARGEWVYIGDQYFDPRNQIKQSGYHLFKGKIGVSNKNTTLSIWAANIFDQHYIDYAYDFGASHLGNPRTFGIDIRREF